MTSQAPTSLRDFVYLDVERVKSLLAQLDQGLLTDRTDTSGSSTTIEGRAGITLPLLAEVGGASQFISTDQAMETRTLHDYVYNYTEAKLIEASRVRRLPEEFDSKTILDEGVRSGLSPVDYVLVKGRPLLNDYRALVTLLKDINNLQMVLGRLEQSQRFTTAETKNDRQRALNEIKRDAEGKMFDEQMRKDLPFVLDIFYKERIIIKMMPFNNTNIRVVESLRPEFLRDRLDDFHFKFGTSPDATWSVFGQIASVPLADGPAARPPQYFSNEIDRGVEGVFESMRALEQMTGVSYPEIAITPIAVYRD